tara:strand:- start:324 stop:542 length:219 start_codon:yes stop_codon:yes gene_type:complete
MAALTTQAATQQKCCCSCEEMLREQYLHLHKSASSALQTDISAKTNDRFRPVKQASAKSSFKQPGLVLAELA